MRVAKAWRSSRVCCFWPSSIAANVRPNVRARDRRDRRDEPHKHTSGYRTFLWYVSSAQGGANRENRSVRVCVLSRWVTRFTRANSACTARTLVNPYKAKPQRRPRQMPALWEEQRNKSPRQAIRFLMLPPHQAARPRANILSEIANSTHEPTEHMHAECNQGNGKRSLQAYQSDAETQNRALALPPCTKEPYPASRCSWCQRPSESPQRPGPHVCLPDPLPGPLRSRPRPT